ncbi:MAG: amidohydrolase [Pseudomonadota bacterium]
MTATVIPRIALGFSLAFCALAPASAQDIFVTNAKGYGFQEGVLSRFDSLLVRDGHVAAAGPAAVITPYAEGVARYDAKGAVVLPGLIDAHGHVFGLGFQALQIDLADTGSLDVALDRIRASARDGKGWLMGRGWNQVVWGLGRFPTAKELDGATRHRPAYFARVDGHAAWVNSRALEVAGITRATPDPQGGRIERDDSGAPTGVLVDAAMALVADKIPPPSMADNRAALAAALRAIAAVGLTGVHDAGVTPAQWAVYQEFAADGRLTARIYGMIAGAGAAFDALAAGGPIVAMAKDRLALRAVKLYADGALGSRGAALLAPYSDDAGNRGLLFHDDVALRNQMARALSRGFQVNVHAIGDAANRQVLDAFAVLLRHDGRDLRHRIEHAQVVAPEDMPRFAALEVIASMQPVHATSDKNMAQDRLGPQRIKGAYAWRSLLAAGARLAAGSDFPVEPANPFYGIHAAVTRRDRAGVPPEGWYKDEALTVAEALKAFTLDAAFAGFAEDRLGSLEPGKWADFILIDRDIFAIDPEDIWKTKVLETWVGGARVYQAE